MAAILQEAPIFMYPNAFRNAAGNGAFCSLSPRAAYPCRVLCQGRIPTRFRSFRSSPFLRSASGSPSVLPSGEWPENFSILNFEDLSKQYESGLLKEEGCTDIDAGKDKLTHPTFKVELGQSWCSDSLLPALINIPVALCFSASAHAEVFNQQINHIYGDLGDELDMGVQVLYLAALLGLVGVASYFVVKQVLIRRDLESAARDLQDRVRTGEAMPVEYFELGAVMLRKKFYVLASKYLEQAIAKWDGDPQDLAQVHNALGFSFVNDDQVDKGIAEYQKALKLQPGYVVAWNNLGSAYEKKKNLPKALEAYTQALLFDPNNGVAKEYRDALKKRVDRLEGVPVKYD